MNLDELRSVQSKERQKDSLQQLRPSFYREVGDYIAELKEERDRVAEAADDPFSEPEVGRLTDEIETAKDVVEAIYERRMGKLVKQASLAAAGMPADDEGLTAEEQDLFEDLVDRIQSNKTRVLDVLEEGSDAEAVPDGSSGTEAAAREAPPQDRSNRANDPPAGDETAVDPDTVDDPATDPPPTPPAEGDGADGPAESDGVTAADVMGGEGPSDASTSASSDPVPPSDPGPAADQRSDRDGRNRADPNGNDETGSTASDPADHDGPTDHDRSTDRGEEPDSSSSDGESEPTADGGPGGDVDRVTVRITRDVGSILGIDDREYTLASDDVVTLPEQNADPLVERDAAEPLE